MKRAVEQYAERAEFWRGLVDAVRSESTGLNDNELAVVLMTFAGQPVGSIARTLGISRQRVQQLRKAGWLKVSACTGLPARPDWREYARVVRDMRQVYS